MAARDGEPLRHLALGLVLLAGCGTDDPSLPDPPSDPASERRIPLGAAVTLEALAEDRGYRAAFDRHFNSMTPENEMKWSELQPEEGEFDFGAADELVEYARQGGKRVRGHTLVWDQQLPKWVLEGDWTRAELTNVLRQHVTTVVRHFRGKVAEWDVVNEPLSDTGGWERNVWYRVIGPAYVGIAFRAARRADPGAKLFLNEIEAERGPKSRALLKFMAFMRARGVPVDGVGLQNHVSAGSAPSARRLATMGRAFRRLGLDWAITEMDVTAGAASARAQAEAYAAAARACVDTGCTGLTVWGVTDAWSWLGEEKKALPFAADAKPKPAFDRLAETLR